MSTPANPKVSRARSFPIIWVVPVIAAAVGAWMLFDEVRSAGPEVTIQFADGSGVEAGKTVLEYKGVAVGTVKSVELKPDLQVVQVKLRIDKNAAALGKEGTLFWIVHPEIGLSGVSGLDTLITGARLNARPGNGPPAKQFVGLEKPPPPEIPPKGKIFILRGDKLGSLTTGASVFYREFKVGEVETSRLADDSTAVLVRIHVDSPYVNLVRDNTRFWNAGGFTFKVSLLGAQLKDTSLESLIAGGVAFATPDGPLEPAASDGTEFRLVAEADKSWANWAPKIPIQSPESVSKSQPAGSAIPSLLKQ